MNYKIKPINDNLVVYYPEGELDDVLKYETLELKIDTRHTPTFSIKDKAIAYEVSDKISIPKGAFVYVAYTVAADGSVPLYQDDSGKYYQAKERDVFMWEFEGEIKTINQWVIVEPINVAKDVVRKSGLIIPNTEKQGTELYGIVRFVNDETTDKYGLNVGDRVLLAKNAHYKFKYNDESLYRVDSNISILANAGR